MKVYFVYLGNITFRFYAKKNKRESGVTFMLLDEHSDMQREWNRYKL